VSDSVAVFWDEAYLSYDLGGDHPLHPIRLELTVALARELGVLDRPNVTLVAPTMATDELLELVHDPDYLRAVRHAPADWAGRLAALYGLGTPDNPVFDRMHEASALITGGTVGAAEAVWRGSAQHGVNIAGGLHHAMRTRASGFCVYNDPAVGIAWLLAHGARRVAYVDVDVHHGDGVQAAFFDDPRVLTISLHETGMALFPGTGFPDEVGRGEAAGTAVNVALPPGTGDAGWLRAFHAVVPVLVRQFAPDVLVSQHGCDTTGPTRWPTSSSPWTGSARRTPRCTRSRTRCAKAAGWPPAAAATSCCRSCPGPGPTCSPRPPAARSRRTPRPRAGGGSSPAAGSGRCRPRT
jgi:acetoin utilization protein AcuC